MNFLNPKQFFSENNLKPIKRLGQNFLISQGILNKIINTSDLNENDIVLEIGSGIGALTQALSQTCKKVIAIEKDFKLAEILKNNFKNSNVEIINTDFLNLDLDSLKFDKVVANLPYYITSPIIQKLLQSSVEKIILMVQKEVGQRICAIPPKMNLLAISVQFYSNVKILFPVSKGNFWPRPKIDSVVIQILKKQKYKINEKLFFQIVKAGFRHPRKQLVNNLKSELKLEKGRARKWLLMNKIDLKARAETLEIKDWINLTKTFK